MEPPSDNLGAELERLALRAARANYRELNTNFFAGSLRMPVFAWSDVSSRLGRWVGAERTLELSRRLLSHHEWGVLVEVLKHEMAHQFVDENLGFHAEPEHGPAFRRVCEERGFDARASGPPLESQVDEERSRALSRVAKLLSLAESPNLNEAQAAMNAAQRLMLKHNLEWVARGQGSYGYRHLGEPSGRVFEDKRILAVILGDHFFVEAIWVPVWRPREGKRGHVLEVCGTPENLELAAYVFDYLVRTADALWRDHKREHGIRSNRERLTFLAGVMSGFRDKLQAEGKRHREEGLVWVGDPELSGYLKLRHPHTRWAHYRGSARSETYGHGRSAGRQIVLARGVRAGPSSSVHLLPPRASR
ncbi:MAG: DUF2786 domain-containing protein [Polyangiaceae bacterium]